MGLKVLIWTTKPLIGEIARGQVPFFGHLARFQKTSSNSIQVNSIGHVPLFVVQSVNRTTHQRSHTSEIRFNDKQCAHHRKALSTDESELCEMSRRELVDEVLVFTISIGHSLEGSDFVIDPFQWSSGHWKCHNKTKAKHQWVLDRV